MTLAMQSGIFVRINGGNYKFWQFGQWIEGCSASVPEQETATGRPYQVTGKQVNTVCSVFRFISAILS